MNCISLASVCFLILFASDTSLAQKATGSPAPQAEQVLCQLCPTISVSCPSDIEVGKPVKFYSSVSGPDPDGKLTYTWEVVGAVIADGQGTPTIRVNRVRRIGDSVTATLRVGGLDKACGDTASCSTGSHNPWPRAEKVAAYWAAPFNHQKAKLNLLADLLIQYPGAQGYLVGYGGRRSIEGETQLALERAHDYLIKRLGAGQARIVKADGGFREWQTIELWLLPAGAYPPIAQPTVHLSEIKFIKATSNKSPKGHLRN